MPRAVATKCVTKKPARKTAVKKAPAKDKGPGKFFLVQFIPRNRTYGYTRHESSQIMGDEKGYKTITAAEKALDDIVDDLDPKATMLIVENVKEFGMVKEKKPRTVIDEIMVLKPKLDITPAVYASAI